MDSSHFFPDLSDIRKFCKLNYKEAGLKEPLQAYYEACFAEPKTRQYRWSHIVVYLTAKQTGWHTLRSEEQRVALPQFERNYEILCNRILDGEDLEADILKGIAYQQGPSWWRKRRRMLIISSSVRCRHKVLILMMVQALERNCLRC